MTTSLKIAAIVMLLAACADSPQESAGTLPRTAWDGALPALQGNCAACHGASTATAGIDFLVGSTDDEIRATLISSGVIDFDDPNASRLFTKGLHEGPTFTADQVDAILQWIASEHP